jgi:inhibitor of KinA
MKLNNDDKIPTWHIHLLGDHAILFSLTEKMDTTINAEIHAFNQFICEKKMIAIKDCIPSYHSLTIVYDIIELQKIITTNLYDVAQNLVHEFEIYKKENTSFKLNSQLHKIPVCYDPHFGIDLEKIAKEKNTSIEKIIETHTSNIYQVFCLGFMPGFAYMGTVESSIQVARHSKPRPLVEAGSVGIAGAQTGIYPKDAPGGWQIIGKTPVSIFDPIKLALFAPGDQVSFFAISMKEFNDIKNKSNNVH